MTFNKQQLGAVLSLSLLGNACTWLEQHQASVKTINIVAFNDFHGQLESPGSLRRSPIESSANDIPVGGVDWLAGYIAAFKHQNPSTIVVSAGDIIGATPLMSALFHDEATIEAMNRLGLEFTAVGNHEFDEGKEELLRMQNGGCHPSDKNSCGGAEVGTPLPFEGARFKFLAANVVDSASGKTLFPAYAIKTIDGVKLAVIGTTLKEAPGVVAPNGIKGLTFRDEAETVNALIPELRNQGVTAIVLLIHQGGTIPVAQTVSTLNGCEGGLEGSPLKAIVEQLDDAVDIVISGHTHQAYNCRIANRNGRLVPVTSAYAQGKILTEIAIRIDGLTDEVNQVTASNVAIDRTNPAVAPDANVKQLVDRYQAITQPIANRVIGNISAAIPHAINTTGESALGDVVADAQLAATSGPEYGKAVTAFINPDGIRGDLDFVSSSAGEGDGKVTYAEAFTVQPFAGNLITMTLTGAQIHTLLEQQFTGCKEGYPPGAPTNGQPFDRILQVSDGFSYEWKEKGTPCDNVDPASIRINGVAVDPAASYRITVNDYLAEGGDQFYVLKQGIDRVGGPLDLDVLKSYFATRSVVSPGPQNRIRRLP